MRKTAYGQLLSAIYSVCLKEILRRRDFGGGYYTTLRVHSYHFPIKNPLLFVIECKQLNQVSFESGTLCLCLNAVELCSYLKSIDSECVRLSVVSQKTKTLRLNDNLYIGNGMDLGNKRKSLFPEAILFYFESGFLGFSDVIDKLISRLHKEGMSFLEPIFAFSWKTVTSCLFFSLDI